MGFWDDVKAEAAKSDDRRADKSHNAMYEGVTLSKDKLLYGGQRYPVRDCQAQVDHGANIAARITGTRVLAGAVLAGPVGAIIGGLARKNRTKVYLAITVPDDLVLVELKAKKEGDARRFAAKVNAAAAFWQDREPTTSSTPPRDYPGGDAPAGYAPPA